MNEALEKLLVIGPSERITKLSYEDYAKYRKSGYKLFAYSGSVQYLKEIGVSPDYYSFMDPNTYRRHTECFESDYFKNTCLVAADLYHNDLERFREYGYTCKTFSQQERELFHKFTLLEFLDNFKQTNFYQASGITCIFSREYAEKYAQELWIRWSDEYRMFKATRSNIDKFSCFLLPLLLHVFRDLKEIKCVGFGDLDVGRVAWGGQRGFKQFAQTFHYVLPVVKRQLASEGISISFVHENVYSRAFGNGWAPIAYSPPPANWSTK